MEEKKKEEKKGVSDIIKKLKENSESLHIARIPIKTKRAFREFSDDEFCGDYGMALKWLVDGIPNKDMDMISNQLEILEARITKLENPVEETADTKTIKMLNGKEVKKK